MSDPAKTDLELIHRYAESRDAEAFAELVKRHGGLVYGTCLRVSGDTHLAEDAAQECFLQMARQAGTIHTSLRGWLHQTALTRSRMENRAEARRRSREEEAGRMTPKSEPAWVEIAPYVDEALAELPEDLREPLILHFLQSRNQEEVASALGLSQPTVSRRIEKGISVLRDQLKKRGVMASVAVLVTLLGQNASAAVPAALEATLGKMALAGPTAAHVAAASAGKGLAAKLTILKGVGIVKLAGISLVAAVVITAGVVVVNKAISAPPASSSVAVPATAVTTTLPPAPPAPPTPIAKADLDRLVQALWAEPPALEILLHREYRLNAFPAGTGEPKEAKPRYFSERVLAYQGKLRLDRAESDRPVANNADFDATYLNGRGEKETMLSIHLDHRAKTGEIMATHWACPVNYAFLGTMRAIPTGSVEWVREDWLGKQEPHEAGESKLVPDPDKIAACATADPAARRVLIQDGERTEGRETVVLAFFTPGQTRPSARVILDKEDFRVCYRAETLNFKTGAAYSEQISAGFAPVQGANGWSFPRRTIFRRFVSPGVVYDSDSCVIESVLSPDYVSEMSFAPVAPADYIVTDWRDLKPQ